MADLTFVEKRPMNGHEHALDAGAIVGREGCDVVLADPEVSRRHAPLRRPGGPRSRGSRVHQRHVRQRPAHHAVTVLQRGDSVRFGNTEWAIRSTPGSAPRASAGLAAGHRRACGADGHPDAAAGARPCGDASVTAAQAVPAAAAPPRLAPAQPAAPVAAPVGRRGDVEAPPEVVPSAIRRVVLPPLRARRRCSRTRAHVRAAPRPRASTPRLCLIIVAAAAAALVIYFITV